jgi:adenosylhomocysteine nucleosidase
VKILTIIPTKEELNCFLQACLEQAYQAEIVATGRLSTTYFPKLEMAVAYGGLGKAQFAVQTQHLIDVAHWDLVICAGAAGALVDNLSVGDVVIATETIEHDIRNRFGKPLLPRFSGSEKDLENCRRALQTPLGFQIHFGPIASGDEDIVDRERRRAIHVQTGALLVAWEGAAGARACQFSGAAYLEIRGVTDSANSAAALDFQSNLEKAMQSVAQTVISLAQWNANGAGAG